MFVHAFSALLHIGLKDAPRCEKRIRKRCLERRIRYGFQSKNFLVPKKNVISDLLRKLRRIKNE